MNRSRRTWIVVIFSVGAAGLFVAAGVVMFPHVMKYFIAAKEIHRMTSYHDFVISGNIVDEQGDPIKGVYIGGSTSKEIQMGFDSITGVIPTNQLTGSSFKFEFKQYSRIYLDIFCEGYRDKKIDFASGGRFENMVIILHRKTSDHDWEPPDIESHPSPTSQVIELNPATNPS